VYRAGVRSRLFRGLRSACRSSSGRACSRSGASSRGFPGPAGSASKGGRAPRPEPDLFGGLFSVGSPLEFEASTTSCSAYLGESTCAASCGIAKPGPGARCRHLSSGVEFTKPRGTIGRGSSRISTSRPQLLPTYFALTTNRQEVSPFAAHCTSIPVVSASKARGRRLEEPLHDVADGLNRRSIDFGERRFENRRPARAPQGSSSRP
jgi:hypothetical protein